MRPTPTLTVLLSTALAGVLLAAGEATIDGDLRTWGAVTLSFRGPAARVTADRPNPFLDYRLQVRFTGPSGRVYNLPGYYDGDGAGGASGNVWRVRFTPDEKGWWSYRASFRMGAGVAVSLDASAGSPAAFDGDSGRFQIAARDPRAPGFARWGRLMYVGGHYLKFRDGPYWIKGGTDDPENLLAYAGFDRTPASHHYEAHVADWRPGDPDWGGGKGKGIIGALNYLASRRVNSIYFLTMNIGGDGQDVWPFAGAPDPKGSPANDNLHYDVGKLRQWDIVFQHAQKQGIFLHFVLNEAEAANKKELDGGELGVERKLYYREISARFGHHLALEWNLCEEYNLDFDLGANRILEFAAYLRALDPYGHPIAVHPAGDPLKALGFVFGNGLFGLTSVQLGQRRMDTLVEEFRRATAAAGRPLPVSMDEFTIDRGQKPWMPVDDADLHRKQKLWPTYLSGGMIEFILEDLLKVESFKTPHRDALWRYTWHARRFLEALPFWEMEPADTLAGGAATIPAGAGRGESFQLGPQVFAKRGEVYAIYLPKAAPTGTIDLSGAKRDFRMRWYNPRSGEFEGRARTVRGGGRAALGPAPADPEQDWVALLEAAGSAPAAPRL